MTKPEKCGKVLLTLREAAKKLGLPDDLLVDLVFVHPPIIDVTLVGRAPRVYAHQLHALRKRWVELAMELIVRRPPLLGIALGSVKAPGNSSDDRINVVELRRIITSVAPAANK